MQQDVTTTLLSAYQQACERAQREGSPPPPIPELPAPGEDDVIGEIRQLIRIPR